MKTNKNLSISEYEFPIEIKSEKKGFYAVCTVWKDCYAQGETIDEVICEIQKVASMLIETYKEESLKIPLQLKSKKRNNSFSLNLNFPLIISN